MMEEFTNVPNVFIYLPPKSDKEKPTIRIFTEDLLQFCLKINGIVWEPHQRSSEEEDVDILFNQTIGNEVLNTSNMFSMKVQKYASIICTHIFSPSNVKELFISYDEFCEIAYNKFCEVAYELYRAENAIENTYIFLAVTVFVSILCARKGQRQFIQGLARIAADIIDFRLLNGFVYNFNHIFMYALHQYKPPPILEEGYLTD